jgi:hypothetical protein
VLRLNVTVMARLSEGGSRAATSAWVGWGTVPLIDTPKEAVLRTGCLTAVASAATRGDLDPGVLAQRLLLAVYAYGTNTGIRAVAAGEHGHREDDIRYVRRRYPPRRSPPARSSRPG